ncbi:hypothetical protein [Mesorhizobium sp. CAU 1732]|uniref:hypothetical protein n=1 Tax=Mesorhizobium sp. CAU 1732 TaxID=3140358 RepID=UPI0032617091
MANALLSHHLFQTTQPQTLVGGSARETRSLTGRTGGFCTGVAPKQSQLCLREHILWSMISMQEVGKEPAMPWIDRLSDAVIAQKVEAGKCRGD